ncbi:MAG: EexN family lipoprotein [Burkholderia gladioli]
MKLNPTTLFLAGLLSFAALLAGCSKPTQIPFLDKVMTADEFTAQPDLREKVLTYCANDSGRVGSDPNCVNAKQSARMTTSGSGNFPRLDISPPSNSSKNK